MRVLHLLMALVLLLAAGCAGRPHAVNAPSMAPSPPATSPAPPSATPSPEHATALAFRLQYGLRADAEWIELVAQDPAARQGVTEFGVPLMPAELAELRGRRNHLEQTTTELLTEIRAYGGLFPEAFADAYLDQRVSIGFVVMFSRDVARHRAALTHLLPEAVRLDVREVRWSLSELRALEDRVKGDLGWTASGRARALAIGRNVDENFVHLHYLGDEQAGTAIASYYGNPPWLSVERAGPLPWTGPRADLVIEVVEADGTPALRVQCEATAENPEAREGGEAVFGTGDSGRCELLRLPVGSYEVVFHRWIDNDHYEPVHALRVDLETPGTRIAAVLPRD